MFEFLLIIVSVLCFIGGLTFFYYDTRNINKEVNLTLEIIELVEQNKELREENKGLREEVLSLSEGRFKVKANGNSLCICDGESEVTNYFDSYERDDLNKICEILNEMNMELVRKNNLINKQTMAICDFHNSELARLKWGDKKPEFNIDKYYSICMEELKK